MRASSSARSSASPSSEGFSGGAAAMTVPARRRRERRAAEPARRTRAARARRAHLRVASLREALNPVLRAGKETTPRHVSAAEPVKGFGFPMGRCPPRSGACSWPSSDASSRTRRRARPRATARVSLLRRREPRALRRAPANGRAPRAPSSTATPSTTNRGASRSAAFGKKRPRDARVVTTAARHHQTRARCTAAPASNSRLSGPNLAGSRRI